MKRRNADIAKLRRPPKKTKIGDGMYGSTTLAYLKMVMLWTAVLMCDFLFELRFEYFWPFWMFARSVYDSFRYQGLAFSLFFVLMTLTSDMICYIFIPVHWLFFAASTYVWVQYVWHAERGICLPTISLWILFIYIEASLRLKDEKHLFFHADFSRPFAAHCIGYPVISLGFSFKSYVGHRFRLRRQRLVARQNDLMVQLLQQALPPHMAIEESPDTKVPPEKADEAISNGVAHDSSPKSNKKASDESRSPKCKLHNGSISGDLEFMEQRRGSINEFDESEDKEKNYKNSSQTQRSSKWPSTCTKEKRSRTKEPPVAAVLQAPSPKDESVIKLELDVKRLRADLNSSRQTEQELRSQVSNLVIQERNARNQLQLLQLDNDSLQSKLHNLVTGRQQDKQTVVTLEKKLAEERKLRQSGETQLVQEKKKVAQATEQASKCTEQCKARRRDLEAEARQLRRENKQYEDRVRSAERELQSLHEVKDSQSDTDVLMSALSAMQDKNQYLEKNLSSETRLKMDLFAALGDAKRELEINKTHLLSREREVAALNAKLAEVLAVMPGLSSAGGGPAVTAAAPVTVSEHNGYGTLEPYPGANQDLYELKMPADHPPKSQLDPAAAAFTPKMA